MKVCVICNEEILTVGHYGSSSYPMHYLCAELQQAKKNAAEHKKELENDSQDT